MSNAYHLAVLPVQISELKAWGNVTGTASIIANRIRAPMDGSVFTLNSADLVQNIPAVKQVCFLRMSQVMITVFGASAGDECKILDFGSFALWAVRVDAAGFNIRVKDTALGTTIATGTTKYAWSATKHDIRVRVKSGTGTYGDLRDYVEVNGAKEITGVALPPMFTGSGENVRLRPTNIADATKYVECGFIIVDSADSDATRQSMTIAEGVCIPESGTPMHDAFTVVFPLLTSKWADVDEWLAGASDGDSTYNESPATASSTFRQTYKTSDPAVGLLISTIRALVIPACWRNTVDAKNMTWSHISGDGTNKEEPATRGMLGTQYNYTRAIFNFAPDGGAWDSTDAQALEVGMKAIIGADAVAMRVTAIAGAFVGCADDPDPDIHSLPHRLDPLRGMIGR